MLDSEGQLLIHRPKTRQKIVEVMEWWTQFFEEGYISPSALVWESPDNNSSFHNRIVAMTPNSTMSIPAARAKEPEVYFDRMATIPYPNKPSGEPMTYLTKVRQVVVFADRNLEDAQNFLSYLIRPELIGSYIEAMGGRFFPVNKNNWDDPFWDNPDDPHISVVRKMFTEFPTRSHYFSDNPGYVEVLEENVWGQALQQIIIDGASPEEATDWAIARITQIFRQWL
ncbi:MAG: extracellular solute-binding protein [Pleurocapsa sp.]